MTKPNRKTVAVSTTTNSGGSAVFSYKFNKKQNPIEMYSVAVNASINGITGNSLTGFEVR